MKYLGFIAILFFGLPSIAETDGSLCPQGSQPSGSGTGVGYSDGACIKICGDHLAADTVNCAEFRLGKFNHHMFEYVSENCTGVPVVTVEMAGTSGATDRTTLGTMSSPGETLVLTERPLQYIFVSADTVVGCASTGLEVYFTYTK